MFKVSSFSSSRSHLFLQGLPVWCMYTLWGAALLGRCFAGGVCYSCCGLKGIWGGGGNFFIFKENTTNGKQSQPMKLLQHSELGDQNCWMATPFNDRLRIIEVNSENQASYWHNKLVVIFKASTFSQVAGNWNWKPVQGITSMCVTAALSEIAQRLQFSY